MLEAGPRLCARSVPPQLSDFLLEKHLREGVEVRLSAMVTSIGSGRERALAVHYSEGWRSSMRWWSGLA